MNGVIVQQHDDLVVAEGAAYSWRWRSSTDAFEIADAAGRTVAHGVLQPAVTVEREAAGRICDPGVVARVTPGESRIDIAYRSVNGSAGVTIGLRFEPGFLWIEPLVYSTDAPDSVVAAHMFARGDGVDAEPTLTHTYLVHPGLCESSALSPILPTEIGLDLVSWLGRGSMGPDSQVYQQWGLPAHFFCGVNRDAGHNEQGSLVDRLSDAFCCGLAELPAADVLLHLRHGAVSPIFSVRGDLWGHVSGPGAHRIGAELVIAFGRDYRHAIRAYHRALIENGRIAPKHVSARKARAATASQFNTWGAQCAGGNEAGRLDQDSLEAIYAGMRASGMRPEMFVIDAKWEGSYGVLEHSPTRFPRFEEFLRRVRGDGHKVGLWAAFMRTDDPTTIGLQQRHLMHDLDGRPIRKDNDFERQPYYLFDISQPEVQEALAERIAAFVRRYDPDLVKFDFGYELPSLSVAAPADPAFGGELLLRRGLDVLVGALRDAKPDIAVMYYSLSPLFLDYLDQHCHDDMYLCVDEYAVEGNRRLFFSSILGELGIPTYGSGGYDWRSMRDLWFDSAIAGPVGSLNGFECDEHGEDITPELAAIYNGLSAVARRTTSFRVDPVSPVSLGSVTGARSSSWLRYEQDALVMACVRAADAKSEVVGAAGLRADTTVVVASFDDAPLGSTSRIGVVPFGDGTVSIARERRDGSARTTLHLLDGSRVAGTANVRDGAVHVTVADRAGGVPLEWIEIEL